MSLTLDPLTRMHKLWGSQPSAPRWPSAKTLARSSREPPERRLQPGLAAPQLSLNYAKLLLETDKAVKDPGREVPLHYGRGSVHASQVK
jgi:hypothetical protein